MDFATGKSGCLQPHLQFLNATATIAVDPQPLRRRSQVHLLRTSCSWLLHYGVPADGWVRADLHVEAAGQLVTPLHHHLEQTNNGDMMMFFPKQKEVCYKQRGMVWPFGELAIENLFKIFQTMMEGAGWRYEWWDMWVPASFLRRGDAEKLMSCVDYKNNRVFCHPRA